MTLFNSPYLLGFDDIERALDRLTKSSGDSYPPYNIEQMGEDGIQITIAVAGFAPENLSVTVEDKQLLIRGRQPDDPSRRFLHRGIAARQFQRAFLLAEGMEVLRADLVQGLLHIQLKRPQPETLVRNIPIGSGQPAREPRVKSAPGEIKLAKDATASNLRQEG